MATQGKKFKAAVAKVDRAREYQIPDAVALVKGASFAKFDETVDVAVRLGVDPRHADQVVRGTVVLPHGTGKPVRVLVITQGERVREAEAAGADFVGIEYIQKLKDGWLECDVIVATPDVMGQLGQLGRVLGPRGLMPNPKAGTVTHGRGQGGPGDQGGQDRVPGGQDRERARPGRQGVVLAGRSWRTTWAPSWTPSSGPSRRRPRASTSARRPSRAPWGRACGSIRRGTDEQDRTPGDGGEPERAAQGRARTST